MILAVRSESPEAQIMLLKNGVVCEQVKWQAHRELSETLLLAIEDLLKRQDASLNDVKGLIVYQGPGSFTGLRISIAVINALAYALQIPAVGTNGDEWVEAGIKKLQHQQNEASVFPEYGALAHITKPRK